MAGKILYKSSVSRDPKKIDSRDVKRILQQIRDTLGENPRTGEPLNGEFEGLFKLRVSYYRVIYAFFGQDILILRIRHRGKAHG